MSRFIKNQIIKTKNNIYDIAKYCLKDPKYCDHNEFICEHILNLSGYKTHKFKLNNGETFCKIYGELNKIRSKIKITYSNLGKNLQNPKMSSKYLEMKHDTLFYTQCINSSSPLLLRFFTFNNIIRKQSLPTVNILYRTSINDRKTE